LFSISLSANVGGCTSSREKTVCMRAKHFHPWGGALSRVSQLTPDSHSWALPLGCQALHAGLACSEVRHLSSGVGSVRSTHRVAFLVF
jgi:hypothetical protein